MIKKDFDGHLAKTAKHQNIPPELLAQIKV